MLLRRGRLRHDAVGRIAIFLGGIHKQQREEKEGTLSADPAVYQFPGEVRWPGTSPHFTQSGFSSVDDDAVPVRDPSGGRPTAATRRP